MATTTKISARTINKELERRGIAERITQGRGYVYFYGGNASAWFSSSISVCYVRDLTVADVLYYHKSLSTDVRNF